MARIISTYGQFNQTYDEPAHLAAGMEWLERGTFTFEPKHPPLARVAVAIGPYLSGIRLGQEPDTTGRELPLLEQPMWWQGNYMLYANGDYQRNLALARMGVLPFFILAVVMGGLIARHAIGWSEGIVAAFVVSTMPPILAHSGIATTDMAITATLALASYACIRWVERPSWIMSVFLGSSVALAFVSKFSAVLFLPAVVLATLAPPFFASLMAGGRTTLRSIGTTVGSRVKAVMVALMSSAIVVWAVYRFSLAPLTTASERPHQTVDAIFGTKSALAHFVNAALETVPVPAPEILIGLHQLLEHVEGGHLSYLLGETRTHGWWYFFPVAIAVKTPLAVLALALLGLALAARRLMATANWRPLAATLPAVAIVAIAMPSTINIGVRHVLPAYVCLAVSASLATMWLWRHPQRLLARGALMLLTIWYVTTTVMVHPNYLSYFNELVGHKPERVLVTSDLDFGQDLYRLAEALKAHEVSAVAIAYDGSAIPGRHLGVPTTILRPREPVHGWVAISEYLYATHHADYAWLDSYPMVQRAGSSIRLYDVP